uniref:(northern house mosquito) hypothetical protein n=1 Tax=Culex pipiens TaxID=7175 RepID=A0A8D8F2E3_CULPI
MLGSLPGRRSRPAQTYRMLRPRGPIQRSTQRRRPLPRGPAPEAPNNGPHRPEIVPQDVLRACPTGSRQSQLSPRPETQVLHRPPNGRTRLGLRQRISALCQAARMFPVCDQRGGRHRQGRRPDGAPGQARGHCRPG